MGVRSGCCFAIGAAIIVLLTSFPDYCTASRITVGDAQHWRFGFNYTAWALKTAPFHQNDTLVFMYDPPSNTSFPHSVYLLKNLRSFLACDLRKATAVGNMTQGGGSGLEFVLKKRKPHYFACGERGGIHCKIGMMKFSVLPTKRTRKG